MSSIVEQSRAALKADPSDTRAFERLEEQYFMAGEWNALVETYQMRLEAPSFDADPASKAQLLFRMAQVIEERCLDMDRAIEQYWKVAKLDSSFSPALRQLRRIYTSREQWDMVLQTAEMEEQLDLQAHEKSALMTELGEIWHRHLNDPGQAMACFDKALALVPELPTAVQGLARVHEALGHYEEAAGYWTQIASRLRGPDRAPVLIALGQIQVAHLGENERAAGSFRRALEDDPRSSDAVEGLIATATALEDWPVVAELLERRFNLASGAQRRTAISVDAGLLILNQLDDTQAARMWFDRALELSEDDITVFDGIAELERRTGDRQALGTALDRVIELGHGAAPVSILLESADLSSERGDEERAVELLTTARERCPEDALVLETLSDGLARLGRHAELVETLEHRASLCGDDVEAKSEIFAELGRVQLEDLNDHETAQQSFAHAFQTNPECPGVVGTLERLYRKNEAWDDLYALLERASVDGAVNRRARCFASLGTLRHEQFDDQNGARSAFDSALELDSGSSDALRGLRGLALASGNGDDLLSVSLKEAAITSNRMRLEELVWTLVPLLEERDRPQEALDWVDKLSRQNPDDERALLTLVRLCESLDHAEQLQDSLEKLNRISTGDQQIDVRRQLATLHHEAGRTTDAIEWYQASLENDPNHLESLQVLKALYSETREFDALARTVRRLADNLPSDESTAELEELATLLVDQLADLEGAIVVLWRLAKLPDDKRPAGIDERLEALLERAGRYEELAQQLHERGHKLAPASDELRCLTRRRASLLLENLGQFEEAASLFSELRAAGDSDPSVVLGLEKALREGNDSQGLADLLREQVGEESDCTRRGELILERASLLEEALGDFDEARQSLTSLADDSEGGEPALEAARRLETLLTRCGDWSALCSRQEARLALGNDEDTLELHEELARLYRDRLDDCDGSIRHLEAAAALAPNRTHLWHNLAILFAEQDRPEDLLRVLESELALDLDDEREATLRARAARLCAELGGREESCGSHYERLLELEPGHPEASEFLLSFYERENRPDDVIRLLRERLEGTRQHSGSESSGVDDDATVSSRTSLRLRIAALEPPEAAIQTLEEAVAELGPDAVVAEPLADLYRQLERRDELIALSERYVAHCDDAEERAIWLLQLGDVLRENDEEVRAIEAYRGVLEIHPENLAAESALRELHRNQGNAGPLVELLTLECARRRSRERIPVLTEMASLLGGQLERPSEALQALLEVLDLDPRDASAFDSALELSTRLDRHEAAKELLATHLSLCEQPDRRADLLEQLADLEAGPLACPNEAIALYREVLAIQPKRSSTRARICKIFEELSRWTELLDCLFLESQLCPAEERPAIFERAIEIAGREISADAMLNGLERLHLEQPEDVSVLRRIADIHRQAGRPEALLRSLSAQLERVSDPASECAIHSDMAQILERDMAAPARATVSLEAARQLDPNSEEVLANLDRLYASMGRNRDRLSVIEERIRVTELANIGSDNSSNNSSGDRDRQAALHHGAATLCAGSLFSPESAVAHLLHSIDLGSETASELIPKLRELQENLRAIGRMDGWARASEIELEQLTRSSDPEHAERLYQLRFELAHCYEYDLARHRLAQVHLLALLDTWSFPEALSERQVDTAELALIAHLRRDRNHVELERRLSVRLGRGQCGAEDWSELATLREERLQRPTLAIRAYREVLAQAPEDLAAIHGLRRCAEKLRHFGDVAESLDLELAICDAGDSEKTTALLHKLSDITWHELRTPESLVRASSAYARILEIEPDDLESLRFLQQVEVERGEYANAAELYEREAGQRSDEDAEETRDAWLRVGELSRDHIGDKDRAIRAFESADRAASLPVHRIREWAELHRESGQPERFVEVFANWCDAQGSPAGYADLLVLAEALTDLGREDEALARSESAIEIAPDRPEAWELAARLREDSGDSNRAAEQWAEAAELQGPARATELLLRAANLVSKSHPATAVDHLRRAADHDSVSALVQSQLAELCEGLERWEEAETAAGLALDMATSQERLSDEKRLDTALAGGRAAWKRDAVESATRFFAEALRADPENIEALESQGELLYLGGDINSARHLIEKRLEIVGENPQRGHHLAIVAAGFELEADRERALAIYREAIELEPKLDEAHEGIVRIHEEEERIDAAIEALDGWIALQEDESRLASQLLHAGVLELGRENREVAIDYLARAVEAAPSMSQAWSLRAQTLWDLERPDEALAVSSDGLSAIDSEPHLFRATLALIRARALEAGGDEVEAAAAYGVALDNDDSCREAALCRARILRDSGQWQSASEILQSFLEGHPEPETPELARVHYKLGRLLAGPLERVEEAVASYEAALTLDPDFSEAREPLANLLSFLPERYDEAVSHHRTLLLEDPFRANSIRALVTINEYRGATRERDVGLAILRAIGRATDEELAIAPDRLSIRVGQRIEFGDASWEKIRQMVIHASQEIAQAIAAAHLAGDQHDVESGLRHPAYRAFWDTTRGAEAELSAPGFESLTTDAIAQTIQVVGSLAQETNSTDSANPGIAESLERSIGRWSRRKLRKLLESAGDPDLATLDWNEWREELRLMAACVSLDRCNGDLRSALITLSADPLDGSDDEVDETLDITDRAKGSSLARRLLDRITASWCESIGNQ